MLGTAGLAGSGGGGLFAVGTSGGFGAASSGGLGAGGGTAAAPSAWSGGGAGTPGHIGLSAEVAAAKERLAAEQRRVEELVSPLGWLARDPVMRLLGCPLEPGAVLGPDKDGCTFISCFMMFL